MGAGDASFHEKSQRRLDRFLSSSSLLALATHAEKLMKKLCSQALLLHNGKVEFSGNLGDVFVKYGELLV
ncbi:MAG: hypothetical protein QGF71_06100 [Rhodospirillales bacterium]|nr:hypothetical protein [Rhodospirillales bacterium]